MEAVWPVSLGYCMSRFGDPQTALPGLRLRFGQQDFYKIQQPSEDLSTGHMYRGPLHALDKKREGSSGAASPPVSSLLEGTFWIRERLNLTYDDMQRAKNLIILILPAVLPAHWVMHRIFFSLISQVLYSIFFGFNHNLLN